MNRDPANIHISEAVQLERRLGGIEAGVNELKAFARRIEDSVKEDRKTAQAHFERVDLLDNSMEAHLRQSIDRNLYPRIEALEIWQREETRNKARSQGVSSTLIIILGLCWTVGQILISVIINKL